MQCDKSGRSAHANAGFYAWARMDLPRKRRLVLSADNKTVVGRPLMPVPATPAQIIAAVRKSPGHRVKVAVSDIDGILRGKYIHKEKFESAVEGGFGFCDVVYGWDLHDQCYDNTNLTGWHKGFPDALARLDLGTHRKVPWDDNVDFFLGHFV